MNKVSSLVSSKIWSGYPKIGAVSAVGCSKLSVDPPIVEEPSQFEAPKAPRLSPKVDSRTSLPQLKNEDGTGRIDGFMVRLKKFLDTSVSVTGTVVFKSSTKWKNKRCTLPHLYVADDNSVDTDPKLLVVKIDEKQMRKFKEVKRFTFQGKLVQRYRALVGKMNAECLFSNSFEAVK